MVVLDPMQLTSNPLDRFEDVLKRQQPKIIGEPIEMEVYSNEAHPKAVGDPWRGAYSNHGFWYKFHWGEEEDFQRLIAFAQSQNDFRLQYEAYQPLVERLNGKILVAKALSGDLMGGIWIGSHGTTSILGCHFVLEEYRHSGIGEKLLRELLDHVPPGNNVVLNAVHPLQHSLSRFGLGLCQKAAAIHHYVLEKPSGLLDLEDLPQGSISIPGTELSHEQWAKVSRFYVDSTNTQVNEDFLKDFLTLSTTHAVTIFDKQGNITALCAVRKTAGGPVGNLIVGPHLAVDHKTAEASLRLALSKYHDPDNDFDFDPDPEAIYRRKIDFYIPETRKEMLKTFAKLCPNQATFHRKRLWLKAASFDQSLDFSTKSLYAISDPHFFFV